MKKQFLAMIVLVTLSSTAFVCTAAAQQDTKKMDHMDMKMKKCVMKKDGKMMMMKDGKSMMMDKDMTMKNGTKVMADGKVMMKDGSTMMMKEGEMMDMDGKMSMGMDKKK